MCRIVVWLFSIVALNAAVLGAAPASTGMLVEFQSEYGRGAIIIKTGERQLYYTVGDGQAMRYDIAVGRRSEQWFGRTYVSLKRVNPTWIPTPDMRRKNPGLPKAVGPGPKNPLGVRALNLGWGAYRIHGTNSPRSIGRAASSGCFRMRNEDVLDLFDRVHIGAPVIVLK